MTLTKREESRIRNDTVISNWSGFVRPKIIALSESATPHQILIRKCVSVVVPYINLIPLGDINMLLD
jgi:hypothetical protein